MAKVKLKTETMELLRALEGLEWFDNAGKPIFGDKVSSVTSWKEAVALCRSKAQANIANESKNLLTEKLCFEFPKRYQAWNNIIESVKDQLDELSVTKTKKVMKENKLPKVFLDAVRWDLMCGCMELEYADLVPPRFFNDRLKWYLEGHFPCGWEGDFPEGHLIVF